jgi:hypothetical protein
MPQRSGADLSIRGYIELAGFVVAMFFVCCALWLWKEKDNAQAALIAAQAVHKTDAAVHVEDMDTIRRITEYKEANDHIVATFVANIAAIDRRFDNLNASISNLRRTNPDVEKYLAMPIPVALRDLLNGVPASDGTKAAAAK